jgi:hypothetical protein
MRCQKNIGIKNGNLNKNKRGKRIFSVKKQLKPISGKVYRFVYMNDDWRQMVIFS